MKHEELDAIREHALYGFPFGEAEADVPKLLDYIDELENMPLIQTVKHLQEENKQLLEFVAWVDEHIMWGNSDGRCIDAKAKARHILEGESHANL